MNPKIKRRWLQALRSGKYTQGKNVLHKIKSDEYCCLGVLCEIAVKDKIIPPPEVETVRNRRCSSYDEEARFPSEKVLNWAGLDGYAAQRIAEVNDSSDSFEEVIPTIHEVTKAGWESTQ